MTNSVIITAYNLQSFIREAVDSVLEQTQSVDEIIVVDDCSTDETAAIIQSYGDKVKYVKMPQNSGGLSATFYGLRQAQGDIVFFLDGDDVWMKEKIETIMPFFEQYPRIGIMSHDYFRVDRNRKIIDSPDVTQLNILRILNLYPNIQEQSNAFKDSIMDRKGYWGGSAYSVRKSFVDLTKFEEWRKSFEHIRFTYLDLVLPTFMIIQHPELMVGYVHKKLFEYRLHGSNTSGNSIPNIEAAKKALRMGHSVALAMHSLLKDRNNFTLYAQKQALLIKEYQYLNDIYSKKKWRSLKGFLFLSRNLWNTKQFIKEAQRLLVSLILGPKVFLYLKSKCA